MVCREILMGKERSYFLVSHIIGRIIGLNCFDFKTLKRSLLWTGYSLSILILYITIFILCLTHTIPFVFARHTIHKIVGFIVSNVLQTATGLCVLLLSLMKLTGTTNTFRKLDTIAHYWSQISADIRITYFIRTLFLKITIHYCILFTFATLALIAHYRNFGEVGIYFVLISYVPRIVIVTEACCFKTVFHVIYRHLKCINGVLQKAQNPYTGICMRKLRLLYCIHQILKDVCVEQNRLCEVYILGLTMTLITTVIHLLFLLMELSTKHFFNLDINFGYLIPLINLVIAALVFFYTIVESIADIIEEVSNTKNFIV